MLDRFFTDLDPSFLIVINEWFIYALLGAMGFIYAEWLRPFVEDKKPLIQPQPFMPCLP